MLFGGHDHCYVSELNQQTGVLLIKSGTDFEVFTNLTVLFGVSKEDYHQFENQIKKDEKGGNVSVFYYEKLQRLFISECVTITEDFEPNKDVESHISEYTRQLNIELDKPAGFLGVDIEARFSRVRTEETNLGNFVADIIRIESNCDFSLSNGGCLRANSVFKQGIVNFSFLSQVLPMGNTYVIVQVPGKIMKNLLENGISAWPNFDGRWPIFSGCKFNFDPE